MVGQDIRDYRLFPALKQNLDGHQYTGDGEAETAATRRLVKQISTGSQLWGGMWGKVVELEFS